MSDEKSRGINLVELVFEWALPVIGAFLTMLLLRYYLGLRSNWWLLLCFPGAIAFQWAVLLSMLKVGSLLESRTRKNDG